MNCNKLCIALVQFRKCLGYGCLYIHYIYIMMKFRKHVVFEVWQDSISLLYIVY